VFYDCTPKNGDSMDKYAYSIQHLDKQLELCYAVPNKESKFDEKTLFWLTDVFFPKFLNWMVNDKGSKPTISSLSHVCIKMYCHLYNQLKEKYAKPLMDVSVQNVYLPTFLFINIENQMQFYF